MQAIGELAKFMLLINNETTNYFQERMKEKDKVLNANTGIPRSEEVSCMGGQTQPAFPHMNLLPKQLLEAAKLVIQGAGARNLSPQAL